MKKLFATILTLVYFVAFASATINVHYCHGKVASVSVGLPNSVEKCPICGMSTQKNGCCKDKQITIKTEKHTSVFPTSYFPIFQFSHKINCFIAVPGSAYSAKEIYYSSPPGTNRVPIYKFYCVFLI